MKIYDITREIREDMQVYKNKEEKKPRIELTAKHDSNKIQESKLHIDSHTGSHIDAPLHMIKNGLTVLDIDPKDFVCDAQVLDLTNVTNKITRYELEAHELKKNYFVLLKTKNSFDKDFNFNFVYLEKSGAEFLISKKVKGVGIDALGIERDQPEHSTHKTLMKNNILIIEGLDLSKVKQGEYKFFFAPLKIAADGAPIRAILIGD